ncbi:MbtH domain protein [bacterium]|nr:MbtH domain protein [bacterium]
MNELVSRLSKPQLVETLRPDKTAKELKYCVDRGYVYVMFKNTGTEVGIQLDKRDCQFENGDFQKGIGVVHLIGGLILNNDKVRCVADIDLAFCEGIGYLEPVSDEEYKIIMGRAE